MYTLIPLEHKEFYVQHPSTRFIRTIRIDPKIVTPSVRAFLYPTHRFTSEVRVSNSIEYTYDLSIVFMYSLQSMTMSIFPCVI